MRDYAWTIAHGSSRCWIALGVRRPITCALPRPPDTTEARLFHWAFDDPRQLATARDRDGLSHLCHTGFPSEVVRPARPAVHRVPASLGPLATPAWMSARRRSFVVFPHVTSTTWGGAPYVATSAAKSASFVNTVAPAARAAWKMSRSDARCRFRDRIGVQPRPSVALTHGASAGGTGCRARWSRRDDGMVETTARESQARGDVVGFQIREFFEHLRRREARGRGTT